jgi:hypothetical protein
MRLLLGRWPVEHEIRVKLAVLLEHVVRPQTDQLARHRHRPRAPPFDRARLRPPSRGTIEVPVARAQDGVIRVLRGSPRQGHVAVVLSVRALHGCPAAVTLRLLGL